MCCFCLFVLNTLLISSSRISTEQFNILYVFAFSTNWNCELIIIKDFQLAFCYVFLSWKGNETQIGQELLNVHMRKAASKILIVMFLSPALTTADSQEIVDFICELHSSTFLSFMDGFVVILLIPCKGEELKFSCDCYFCTIAYSEKKIKWHKNMRKTLFFMDVADLILFWRYV